MEYSPENIEESSKTENRISNNVENIEVVQEDQIEAPGQIEAHGQIEAAGPCSIDEESIHTKEAQPAFLVDTLSNMSTSSLVSSKYFCLK